MSTGLLSPPPSALPVFDQSEQRPIPGGDSPRDENNTDTCKVKARPSFDPTWLRTFQDVCKPVDPIEPSEGRCTLRSPPLTPSPNLSPLSAPSEPQLVCKENQQAPNTSTKPSPPLKFIDFKQKRSEEPQFAVTRGRICSSPSCSTVIFGNLPGAFCRSCKKRFERSGDVDATSSTSTVFRIRIPSRSNALPSPSPTPAASSSRPTSPDPAVEADETIRGWDSELSDLTDTSDDDSGDDEMACDASLEGQDSNVCAFLHFVKDYQALLFTLHILRRPDGESNDRGAAHIPTHLSHQQLLQSTPDRFAMEVLCSLSRENARLQVQEAKIWKI